jgi:hypothetical protein
MNRNFQIVRKMRPVAAVAVGPVAAKLIARLEREEGAKAEEREQAA